MRNARGELAERSEFFGLDQAILGRLQLAQGFFGRVPRQANCFLGALALGDVGIDHHEATACDGIAAHLDDAAVRARTLQPQFAGRIIQGGAQLRFEIGREVFASFRKIVEILDIARPTRQEGVGEIEQLLEIAIPRSKARPLRRT